VELTTGNPSTYSSGRELYHRCVTTRPRPPGSP